MCEKCVQRSRDLWDIADTLDSMADLLSEMNRAAGTPMTQRDENAQKYYRRQADIARDIADEITPSGGQIFAAELKKETS